MQDPRKPRRSRSRAALGLLLALAACGPDDDGPRSAAPADSAQLRLAAAPDSCPPPPIPPADVVREGAPWSGVEQWLKDHDVTFPDIPGNLAEASVPLCDSCSNVRVRLQSGRGTHCLKTEQAAEPRIAGRLTLLETFPAQHEYETIPANGVLYMFSRGTPVKQEEALLVYNHEDRVRHAPRTAWLFYYCTHQPGADSVQAQWRPRRPGPGNGNGPGTSYAWMACANGCCQFYTPPPVIELPDTASQRARDRVPAPDTIPAWCTGANHP